MNCKFCNKELISMKTSLNDIFAFYRCNYCSQKCKSFNDLIISYDKKKQRIDCINFNYDGMLMVSLNYYLNKTNISKHDENHLSEFTEYYRYNFIANITPDNFNAEIKRLKDLYIYS